MSHFLTYKEEMKRLEKLLAEVSTDEESVNEENEEIVDEEYFSDHQSHSEEEVDSSIESDCCEPWEYYLRRDSLTEWNKKESRKNMGKLAHNIIIKLPINDNCGVYEHLYLVYCC